MNKRLIFSCLGIAALAAAWGLGDQFKAASGWSKEIAGPGIPGGQNAQGFALGRDPATTHGGKAAFTIQSLTADTSKWRSITQGIRADAFRGKRVRLRGYIKTKEASGSGLWMRVDTLTRSEAFDNMGDRIVKGTSGWSRCDVVLDVSDDAVLIFFGALTIGTGQMWVSDLSLEPVSKSVPVTGALQGPFYSRDPLTLQNLDFTAPPKTESKADIPAWSTTTDEWNDQLCLDTKVTHNGKPSAQMHSTQSSWDSLALWQEIQAAPYRGKRIEYRVFIKTEGNVSGGPTLAFPGGGQWLVADIPKFVQQGKKWVPDTREWKPVSVVGFVPKWANCIQVGVQLNSAGRVWVSDATFRIVPDSTPLTYAPAPEKLYTAAQIKTFAFKPTNLMFTR